MATEDDVAGRPEASDTGDEAASGHHGGFSSVDLLVAIGLGIGALVTTQAARELGPAGPWIVHPSWPTSVVLLLATIAPVATRRRLPILSLVVATTGICLVRLFHVPETQATSIALFLALHAAGRWGSGRLRDPVRGVVAGALLVVLAFGIWDERNFVRFALVAERPFYLLTVAGIGLNLAFLAAGWLLGNAGRARAERELELAARTVELEREREENARRAVLSERLRIAREIHDVVAHHVSVMGIQAGAARRVLGEEAGRLAAPLRSIETSSREAVIELQRLLSFLRAEGQHDDRGQGEAGSTDRQPLPGMAQLANLRRQMADAGLACTYRVTGEERQLPPAVDLSAYRIIQESLTNVLKHAGVDRASLELTYGPEALVIEVRNARRHGSGGGGTGTGLRGMAERASLVGGRVLTGAEGDEFRVLAELPYGGAPVQDETAGTTDAVVSW